MSSAKSNETPNRSLGLIVFGHLFALSLGLQWHSGAYRSDFGGHADEAAHVVTGLMVRDYLGGGFLETPHPVRFAEDYYDRFPKVAIGHYPPLFYLIEGLWLLPFRSGPAILVLMAALSAGAGWLTWRAGRVFLKPPAALGAALVFCLLPLIRTYTAVVMSDLLLVIFSLGAAMAFTRFLEREKARDSLLFGALAAAAILTKGAGLYLALVPPIAIILSGKLPALRNWRLWIAVIPVLVFALPWILATRHITAEGMADLSPGKYLAAAPGFYGAAALREFGFALLPLAAAALVLGYFGPGMKKRKLPAPLAVQAATAIGLFLFFLVIPSGFDARYLIPAAPALALLAFSLRPADTWIAAAVMTVLCVLPVRRPVEKRFTGAKETVELIEADSDAGSGESRFPRILVLSNPNGEGAVTAAATLTGRERLRVIRASKALAETDWLGKGYRSRFASGRELLEFFRSESIGYLVLDGGIPESQSRPHHRLLESTVEKNPESFERIGEVVSRRKIVGDTAFTILRIRPPADPSAASDSLDFRRD